MANLVYGISITNFLFEGEVINSGNSFLKTVKTTDGKLISMPISHTLFNTAEERNLSIFRNKKNHLSFDKVAIRYNISLEEVKEAYDKAIKLFPEKFI